MSPPLVTLTSDFGMSDGYVATMKGVILSICPDARLIDISHEVPPQNINHAAFVLGTTYRHFPGSAVHLAVVDPGVGSARHPILLVTPHGSFVGPDNGLFSFVLSANGATLSEQLRPEAQALDSVHVNVPDGCQAFLLNRAEYWMEPVSDTFHGRDIFAPAAGHLAAGIPAQDLGSPLSRLRSSYFPPIVANAGRMDGHVIHVDRFGNLVTDLVLEEPVDLTMQVEIRGQRINGISRNYQSASGLLAIKGSHGFLEIAYRNDSASKLISAYVGAQVTVLSADSARRH